METSAFAEKGKQVPERFNLFQSKPVDPKVMPVGNGRGDLSPFSSTFSQNTPKISSSELSVSGRVSNWYFQSKAQSPSINPVVFTSPVNNTYETGCVTLPWLKEIISKEKGSPPETPLPSAATLHFPPKFRNGTHRGSFSPVSLQWSGQQETPLSELNFQTPQLETS